MDSGLDWHAAYAALEWQYAMGVEDAVLDAPINRFETSAAKAASQATSQATPALAPAQDDDPVAEARAAAAAASDLATLEAAMAAYPHCQLKRGARNLVFADGTPEARVMIVGEAPGREEDLQGKPFVGRAGHLLDRMFDAIGLNRTDSLYITNVLPWRPPQNRDPRPDEIAMLLPFLERHIALVDPAVLVVMGNISAQALLGRRGILRLRGQWAETQGRPALPMTHPAYLLRTPQAKRDAWADLLSLKARVRTLG